VVDPTDRLFAVALHLDGAIADRRREQTVGSIERLCVNGASTAVPTASFG